MKATLEILNDIESKLDNGHTLKSVYQFMISNLDEFGSCHMDFNSKGFKLFYTSNHNFCQGIKNGYGAGFYAVINYKPGLRETIKLPTY